MNSYLRILSLLSCSVLCMERKCGCDWSGNESANCSNRKNVDFPCVAEKEAKEIILSGNGYTSVPDELLQNCKLLKSIFLSNNRIQRMPNELSSHCPLLAFINLDNNSISDPFELLKIGSHVRVRAHYNPMICACKDAEKILDHTNAQKATVMCTVKIFGKQKAVPYAKYCNEHRMNEANRKYSRGMLNRVLVFAVIALV